MHLVRDQNMVRKQVFNFVVGDLNLDGRDGPITKCSMFTNDNEILRLIHLHLPINLFFLPPKNNVLRMAADWIAYERIQN